MIFFERIEQGYVLTSVEGYILGRAWVFNQRGLFFPTHGPIFFVSGVFPGIDAGSQETGLSGLRRLRGLLFRSRIVARARNMRIFLILLIMVILS